MESVHWIMSLSPCKSHCLWSKNPVACPLATKPFMIWPLYLYPTSLLSQPHSLCSDPTRLPAGRQTLRPAFSSAVPSAWDALLPTLCSYIFFLSFWSQLKCHLFYKAFLDYLPVSTCLPPHMCIPFPPFLVFSISASGLCFFFPL